MIEPKRIDLSVKGIEHIFYQQIINISNIGNTTLKFNVTSSQNSAQNATINATLNYTYVITNKDNQASYK